MNPIRNDFIEEWFNKLVKNNHPIIIKYDKEYLGRFKDMLIQIHNWTKDNKKDEQYFKNRLSSVINDIPNWESFYSEIRFYYWFREKGYNVRFLGNDDFDLLFHKSNVVFIEIKRINEHIIVGKNVLKVRKYIDECFTIRHETVHDTGARFRISPEKVIKMQIAMNLFNIIVSLVWEDKIDEICVKKK